MTELKSGETRLKMMIAARPRMRPVIQLTKELQYVNEYESVSAAARITRISKSGIMNCLSIKNIARSAGGYIWGYKSDFTKEGLKRLTDYCP